MSGGGKNPADRLAAIATMERPALLQEWLRVHGKPSPKNLSIVFLRKSLAFERQCAAYGGLKTRSLARLSPAATSTPAALKPALPVGAQLMREWNGRTYQIAVTETGFDMDGKNWGSLSAIAQHITGAHWSGPRFFGLTPAPRARTAA